ncbi:hypothetical protein NA57DRAFT_75869 [Rhizodiscina lignyota]|uniref:Uncharacterized protein n=1 Tax=Rhizodiscina lignyota TaxID=1504668 RepID=A0A9P4IB48_9PEZI|nr:hypothetical protein NA57DRAFT_75869 [Rhizodiscina lignyota]
MATLVAEASVLDGAVSLGILRGSFTSHPNALRNESGPPQKKQRLSLSKGGSALSQEEEDGTFPDDVVLAQFLISLQYDHASRPPHRSVANGTVPIFLNEIKEVEGDAYVVCISPRTNRSISYEVVLQSKADTLEPVVAHLERVCRLFQTPSKGRSVPAWAPCRLIFRGDDVRLEISILWRKGVASVNVPNTPKQCLELLSAYVPDVKHGSDVAWSLSDFYDNVHVPPRDMTVPQRIREVDLECDLYPFQQRAVDWMLKREWKTNALPSCFRVVEDCLSRKYHFSNVHGLFLDEEPSFLEVQGGILCEEMGLGKTVELLALISLNRRDPTKEQRIDPNLTISSATLIITPPHILQQWQGEISRHAPHLKVLNYTGLQAEHRNTKHQSEVEDLLQYDIVLTTYNVLSREIHYAERPPERNLRHAKQYEARRSPLVQISWWRVCLDEAQMIESGVTKAAIVARLIPRCNAWAITGTPLKKNIEDLFGLILFLGLEPFCASKKVWSRVDKPLFKEICSTIALRHTKDLIRQELRLPPQKRVVITMPFTAIEEQNYSRLVQEMCDECGLTPDGAPAVDDLDLESPGLVEKMRGWLRRLRQTCLHPQVGGRNRRALGRGNGPLKSVNEVLEIMIDQNETNLKAEQRQVVLSQVRHAHIIANNNSESITDRWSTALDMYTAALKQASGFVDVIRTELAAEKEKESAATVLKDPESSKDGSSSETEAEEEKQDKNSRLAVLQKTLRAALEVLHVCAFFVGTAYFQLKSDENKIKPESEDFHRLEKLEMEFYDEAKSMRKEMLREWHDAAQRLMRKVSSRRNSRSIPKIPSLKDFGGIESRKFLEKFDDLSEMLDRQTLQVEKLRSKATEYLLLNLVDEDEGVETTGDEYEDSTKKQDELYAYITALRAAVSDRHRLLTGQSNFLIDSEIKEALKLAKEGEGHAPELFLQLMDERQKLLPKTDEDSLRAIISQIRGTVTTLQWQSDGGSSRAGSELSIVEAQLKETQQISSTQVRLVGELEKDLELFTKTMNQRLEFYRQLQIISDTVAPYKEDLDDTLDLRALQKQQEEQNKSDQKLATLTTKRRFLMHLQNESTSQEARMCVICQSTFELGVLTVCGHQYCKECIRLWWREHRNCPVCKRNLHLVDFHDITYRPDELRAEEENNPSPSPSKSDSGSPRTSATSIYSDMNANTLIEIKSVDLNGSYGTKIDTIAKHLLWIREHDPGSKSLIFSQYPDFLQVLGGALRHFKIGYSSFSDKLGVEKFKKDASVETILLDAKSDSSGLNLVNATHVFLCEPLINTTIELQAINRVHRIGQQRPTAVYMYLISDTVEESIYDISVSRRLAHMGGKGSTQVSRSGTPFPQLQETALDAANTLELQQAPISTLLVKGRSGGEVVEQEDLWGCLFGKVKGRREKVSGEMAREVDRFLRAEAAESRRAQNAAQGMLDGA